MIGNDKALGTYTGTADRPTAGKVTVTNVAGAIFAEDDRRIQNQFDVNGNMLVFEVAVGKTLTLQGAAADPETILSTGTLILPR